MSFALYASFLLTREQMEHNGVTSHQIIKFSYRDDPATPAYARLLDVLEDELFKVIRDTLKHEPDMVYIKRLEDYCDRQFLIKVFPREDIDQTRAKLSFLSAQREAHNVLQRIIQALKCEVIQELPNLRAHCPDIPCDWTMRVSTTSLGKNVIEIQKATSSGRNSTATVGVIIQKVKLKNILYVLKYMNHKSPKLERLHNSSLDPVRKVETFAFDYCYKRLSDVLLNLKTMIEQYSQILDF